jgi:hypothetical protein
VEKEASTTGVTAAIIMSLARISSPAQLREIARIIHLEITLMSRLDRASNRLPSAINLNNRI